ncbi:MAG: TOBE domain-containing protein, partial [Desulfamplus sp.]|nr:TOBE domain-containing protein [Desulfamplus sp.]
FVADFLGHSNFMDARVEEMCGDLLKVRLDDGSSCLVSPVGDFSQGDGAEIVIRAQKMKLSYQKDHDIDMKKREELTGEENMNFFFGTVVDRSYMGGEVSYFVELANKKVLHVINFVKRTPYRRKDEVVIRVDPAHCRLLKKE